MWVRNAWYVAAWREDVAAGAVTARTIINQPIVLYRKADGGLVVLEDRCCHRLAPLSKGRLEGDDLRCMYHGMRFAPDGRCVEIPGQAAIPAEAKVRTFPAAESGAWIWVWMGEAEKADPATIPSSIAGDDPAWRIGIGHLDYDADYRLINDNLLDLSHLGFTHAQTLGRGSPRWATERPKVTRLDRGLRFQRWLRDYRDAPSPDRVNDLFDLWHSYDFVVPGIFLQRVAWYPLGTAERVSFQPPTSQPIYLRLDEQAVTPMTGRTARYYFAAGARSTDVSPAIVAKMVRFTERAFQEDKAIIEAQQKAIDRDPGHPMLGTSFDAGPTRFRTLMDQLIAGEARAAA